ncbi:hypothetical protein VW35_08325 [Devosia soli]|uniref:Uncharacterized protein n=1 Tax=Devosia soli TaxID=361041 RepID=A0A0F5LDU7_9HYPH|nr:hypothetical protein [Devosia soli]KKB80379.1 hypothetical protein VW35_08325 [Devosia soli]
MIDGGSKDMAPDDLQCSVGIFNADDIDDLVAASSVTVYRLQSVLDFDEYEELCSAIDASGSVERMHAAIKANAAASKWFTDNGIDPDSTVVIVDNTDDTMDLYIR